MKCGLLSIVTLAGAISTALLWSMSASDPYWRLVEAPSVPAPAYKTSDELRASLVTAPLEFSNLDTAATNPATEREAIEEQVASDQPPVVPIPRDEPEIAASFPTDAPVAVELPRAAISAPAGFDLNTDVVVNYPPGPGLSETSIIATEDTEAALELDRTRRADVQRRLSLAGFDPNGHDGVFGERTRGAIADFQSAWGFKATGYLEPEIYAELQQRTEDAYQALRQRAAAAPSAAPALAPTARGRQFADADDDGRCARDSEGRIIERQSLACDIAGFGEQVVSLGRNTLAYEEDKIASTLPTPISGVDR